MEKCKRCGCEQFYIQPRIEGQDIMKADMVAQRCVNCNFFKRWCPKNERHFYIKNKRATSDEVQKTEEDVTDKKAIKEGIESVLKGLFAFVGEMNKYELYQRYITEPKSIFENFFTSIIKIKEGSSCCADKGRHVANLLVRAFKEKQNIVIAETYNQYKERGGKLGGLNESNTDMNMITYWSPNTIKDTDHALELFQATLFLDYKVIQNYLERREIE